MRLDRSETGPCHVCGAETKMSFEHLPPAAAGNKGAAEMLGIEAWLGRTEDAIEERGQIVQRGSGAYSLCADCNSRAGSLYVPELLEWTTRAWATVSRQQMEEADRALEPRYLPATFRRVRPARFVKQMVTMLLAVAGPELPPLHPELQEYARDPKAVGLPAKYQLYLVLFGGPIARFNGGTAAARLEGDGFKSTFSLELAHPPYAYVMTIDEGFPAVEAGNITGCVDLGVDQTADLEVDLRAGFGHTAFPLDFRSKAMLDRDRRKNEEHNDLKLTEPDEDEG